MGIRVTGLIAAATVVCALGTGVYMQRTADMQRSPASSAALDQPAPLPTEPETGKLVFQDVAYTSARTDTRTPRQPLRDVDTSLLQCASDLKLTPMPNALLRIEISAPCRGGERFTLHHSGVMVTQSLDAAGEFSGVLPALAARAVVIADFASGQDLEAVAKVSDLDSVERVVMQWQGDSGLELHALEFGATYGSAGHVWKGSEPGQGAGQVLFLGDPAQVAARLLQVYTLPKNSGYGVVNISVEAEITSDNCDQVVAAQLVERRDDRLRTRDLVLNIPECSATGDFLVLNNLVESLKIASN
ncbi:hypothetical protein [Tritonibacter mobilis]|uniref:hypothetical protein n=1 Tax=Tritonibacter mobilis TaxID=379347 RepID=UPI000806D898|nr:hypothetical protein [Tritonibacter mobilis]GLP87216.1 hypothetical protein GCM10007921_27760 [Tritonibacter mobilis]SDW44763.1 hypothetical protein SAMN05444385_102267 [Tritonibacter mobilis]